MEEFQDTSAALIIKAMGKLPHEKLTSKEHDELEKFHFKICIDTSYTSPKEIEAYLVINRCKTYEEYADFLLGNRKIELESNPEKKDIEEEREKLINRLRTRAHRGREKILKELKKIYETEETK
ncbi:hypothetical protein C6A37_01190 [Desulfobacteraceae bacterium SEEP-SAG9]|nr:hypothetical protein C6A37_01190 [Desulfobacteraceae bacterium SEEP-SAG9]